MGRPRVLTADWWMGREPAGGRRFNEYNASGAAVFFESYGDPGEEPILPTFQGIAQSVYSSNAVVYGLAAARMMILSEAELKWQSLTDRHLFGTPALSLLEEPWPNGDTAELLGRMELDATIAGNSFTRSVDGVQLERLRPDRVKIISELRYDLAGRPYRVVIGYLYDREGIGRDFEPYTVDEVAHYAPSPDPCAHFRGMSWLTPVMREIRADQGMTEFKVRYLEHNATPNMLVKYEKKIAPKTIGEMAGRLASVFGGPANAGKTLILDEGADATLIGNSLEQMEFADVQAAGENRIAVAAGVPGIVAGLKEGLEAATYSNYEQAMRRYADGTMRPLWRKMVTSLRTLVEVPADARLWYDTSEVAALQEGEQQRAETFLVRAQTAETLLRAGYQAAGVPAAVSAGDLSLLVHSGLFSVQLQAPGSGPDATSPAAGPAGQTDPNGGGQS